MAFPADFTTTCPLPVPSLRLLPKDLRDDEKYTATLDKAVTLLKAARTEVQTWQRDASSADDYRSGRERCVKALNEYTREVKGMSVEGERICNTSYKSDTKEFLSAWRMMYDMVYTEFLIAQFRLIFKLREELSAFSATPWPGGHRYWADNFFESHSAAIASLESLFNRWYNIFAAKSDGAYKEVAYKDTFERLVLEAALDTKDLEAKLEDQAKTLDRQSGEEAKDLKELISLVVESIRSSTLDDQSTASVLNEEKPRLPLIGLINDCRWLREVNSVLLRIRKKHNEQIKSNEEPDLNWRAWIFDEQTGDRVEPSRAKKRKVDEA